MVAAAKVRRVQAAKAMLSKGIPDNLIFVDESWIDSDDHVGYQLVAPGEAPLVQHISQGCGKVMVFGMINRVEKRLVVLPHGAMDAEAYIRHCVQPNLDMLRGGTLIQDNAKPHIAFQTLCKLALHEIRTIEWPPYSPDLNPIEQLWGIVKKKVSQRAPFGRDEISRVIKEEWDAISMQTVRNLIDSFPKRLREVIRKKGDTVRL